MPGRYGPVQSNSGGLRVPQVPTEIAHAAYKCYVFVEPDTLRSDWSRDRIIAEISAKGVPCYSGSCSEVYLEKAFDGTEWRPSSRMNVARKLGETSLMFFSSSYLERERSR